MTDDFLTMQRYVEPDREGPMAHTRDTYVAIGVVW
jgi:hypothetical protein